MTNTDPRPTADLCDENEAQDGALTVLSPIFRDFGGRAKFCGKIVTLRCADDNSKVREQVEQPGEGRVLVVDGGASLRCALLGGNLAQLAAKNGWAGIVIYGCVRDSAELKEVPIGIRALATQPRRSEKRNSGNSNVIVHFANAEFVPGHFLTADEDGIIISPAAL